MTGKERVAAAIDHQEGDRVPIFGSFVPEVQRALRFETGSEEPDLGVALGNDMVKSCAGLENSFYLSSDPEYICPWGITWHAYTNEFGEYTEIVGHPLAGNESKLDSYEIPDPEDPKHYTQFLEFKGLYGDDKWLIGSCQISVFEAAWYLRGMDQLMLDMILAPDYVHALMDKVMQFPLAAGRKFAELGADMVWLGDDVATQSGMMMSLDMWRTFLKPRYARLIAEFKQARPGVKVAYHSCGNCEAILNDMIEIGLDVLNPIQPLAIDPDMVKQKYGDRLTLFGGLDIQHLLPTGSPVDIAAAVHRLKSGCGKGGGYILAPAHHIQSDTSVENVLAYYRAAKEKTL